MANISDGTPGMAATRLSPSFIQMPGAVPRSLGIGSAPAGNSACTRLRSGIVRLRRRNIAWIWSNDSAWKTSSTPATLGQHLARQVVLRRAEAAGGDDEAGPLRGDAEGVDVGVEVVGDGGVPADGDADLGEPPAEPLAVGVEVLAAGQLAADGDDFALHRRPPVCTASPDPSPYPGRTCSTSCQA